MEDLREEEQEKKKKEKQRKKKRKREKKMKGGGEKEEKRTQPSHNGSSLKSANDTTGEDLQLDLEIEVGFPDPPCQPGQNFLVQNGLYRCPTYSTTCFMLNSHLLGVF